MRLAFKNEKEITAQWLDYYAAQAHTLAKQDEWAIRNFMDREVLNPEMQDLLKAMPAKSIKIPDDDPDMELVLDDSISSKSAVGDLLRSTFGGMKKKVRRIFCQVVSELNKDGDIDIKSIIKTVLLALLPAFASGVPAAILPVVIALTAMLLKHGYKHVCGV